MAEPTRGWQGLPAQATSYTAFAYRLSLLVKRKFDHFPTFNNGLFCSDSSFSGIFFPGTENDSCSKVAGYDLYIAGIGSVRISHKYSFDCIGIVVSSNHIRS